ncbi:MAG: SufD family Fe-S cluster assembly protein [Verrucomicrobiota bacterium]|nr:SufD family Fe-S cluster assembly protein [Verrucomicrobiota bacterium]
MSLSLSEQVDVWESDVQMLLSRDPSLQEWRRRSWEAFTALDFPSTKRFWPRAASLPVLDGKDFLSPHSLLFVDGFFQDHSLPKPFVALPLDAAMRSYGLFVQSQISRAIKEEKEPMAALNLALHGRGAFLYLPPGVHIEKPIELHHLISSAQMSSPYLQLVLGKGSSLSLIQRCRLLGEESPFVNVRVDLSLDAGASLFWQDESSFSTGGFCSQALRAQLKRESRLHLLSLPQGAEENFSSFEVRLKEEGGSALIQSFAHLEGVASSTVSSMVEHVAPSCFSRQHVKTILAGKSRSLFAGKILIRPEAQKSEAYQSSNHLLLSQEAHGAADPHLEIFADDVKASHGATFSSLSEEELFYLASRGVPREEAKTLLIRGFSREILEERI